MINGTIIEKKPDAVFLRRMKLGKWLDTFAKTLVATQEKRGGMLTPFAQATNTHLAWASQWIEYLEAENRQMRKALKLAAVDTNDGSAPGNEVEDQAND